MKKSDNITIRPATRADIALLLGPDYDRTMRAFVADLDGVPACIAGLEKHHGVMVGFSTISPHVVIGENVTKLLVWRTAKKLLKELQNTGYPFIVVASRKMPGAPAFLERLGFTYSHTSGDGEIYKWPTL